MRGKQTRIEPDRYMGAVSPQLSAKNRKILLKTELCVKTESLFLPVPIEKAQSRSQSVSALFFMHQPLYISPNFFLSASRLSTSS